MRVWKTESPLELLYSARGQPEPEARRERHLEVVGVEREDDEGKEWPCDESEAGRRPDLFRKTCVPHRSRVKERHERAVPILHGRGKHPVGADRRDVVLVPTAQRPRITKRKSFEERGAPVDVPTHAGDKHLLVVPGRG